MAGWSCAQLEASQQQHPSCAIHGVRVEWVGKLFTFSYPRHNSVPCIPDGAVPHILTNHLASGISLVKSWSQEGFWLSKWTLAVVLWTAIIRKFTLWNNPKLAAKVRVSSEEFGVGISYHQITACWQKHEGGRSLLSVGVCLGGGSGLCLTRLERARSAVGGVWVCFAGLHKFLHAQVEGLCQPKKGCVPRREDKVMLLASGRGSHGRTLNLN
eukprot:1161687-Pelagomonas_calceolata.AAC.15